MVRHTYLGARWRSRCQRDGLFSSGSSLVHVLPSLASPLVEFEDHAACFMIAIWRAIYETKARCRHFRFLSQYRRLFTRNKVVRSQMYRGQQRADAQNVVQIVTSDKAKAQAYCDLSKLSDKIEAAGQKNDAKIVETLAKQADALVAKLGPEYSKLIDGLEQVDPDSSEAKELMTILSGLDNLCSK